MQTKREKTIILLILLTATILSPLDFYIVNLALTPIQQSIEASPSQLQMIVSFYACGFAVFQITGGRLGDQLGRKRIFMTGLMGFIISSAICGAAHIPQILILGRVLQGISGAIMAPQILAIIHTLFSEEEKTKVMALYSFTFGIAAVLGQILGGVLISMDILGLGWRTIFLINLPIGLLAFIGAAYLIPKIKSSEKGKTDVWGIVLFSAFLTLIVYPLTQVGEQGWTNSILLTLACSVLFLLLFVVHEKRVVKQGETPLIDMEVFKYKNLSVGAIVAFLFYSSGVFFLALGVYLQESAGLSTLNAGAAIIPFGIGFMLSSLLAPIITKYLDNRILNLGLFSFGMGFGLLILALNYSSEPGLLFYAALFVCGLGMGTTLSSIVRISLVGIAHRFAGLAAGVINSALQIGSAIGVAALGSLFFSQGAEQGFTVAFTSVLTALIVIVLLACIIAFTITQKQKK